MNLIRTLPHKVIIAYSGGIDSSALLFLALSLKRDVTLCIFDHGDDTSKTEVEFAQKISTQYSVPLIIGQTDKQIEKGDSKERFWSECRNSWFNSLQHKVAVAHNLDDALEWYLMTAMTGNGGYYMDYTNKNVIRPLLVTKKQEIVNYVAQNEIAYIHDATNDDLNFNTRNKVRHSLIPEVLKINPGIYSTIKKNIIRKLNAQSTHKSD